MNELFDEWKSIPNESTFVGKLVRDKIPQRIILNGDYASFEKLTDNNRIIKELNNKLLEECLEYSKDMSVEELADIVEVIYGILHYKNISIEEFEGIRNLKKFERGGFENGVYLNYIVSDNEK